METPVIPCEGEAESFDGQEEVDELILSLDALVEQFSDEPISMPDLPDGMCLSCFSDFDNCECET